MGIIQHFVRPRPTEDVPPPPILGIVLTSGLYPVLVEGDAVNLGISLQAINTYTFFGADEQLNLAVAMPAAPVLTATVAFKNYTDWPVEAVDLAVAMLTAPALTTIIAFTTYSNWPVEAVDLAVSLGAGSPIVLTVTIQYVNYINWPIEAVDLSATVQGVTLA